MSDTKKRKKQKFKRVLIGEDTLAKLTPDNAMDVFKDSVRAIYQGLPTRPARYLLVGLRRPVKPEQVIGFRGLRSTDKLPYVMCQLGLMEEVPLKIGRRGTMYFTTEKGLSVLEFWSSRNVEFGAYLRAYCPMDIRDQMTLRRIDIKLEE